MSNYQLKTPVAFIIFNRPDTTKRVFAQIAKARPPKLLVIADGPRANDPDDAKKCALTREIINRVDWDCEVLTNYSDINLGCKYRISSGLDWVFNTVEEAIILEDDCLPHPTFFRFCEEMLDRYRDDERIWHIGGLNAFTDNSKSDTYFYSKDVEVWGWATWNRAWKSYDVDIKFWPALRKSKHLFRFLDKSKATIYNLIYNDVYNNKINTWAYQWQLCVSLQGLSIYPDVNLISNIGFNRDATHTTNRCNPRANLKFGELVFPLKHPEHFIEFIGKPNVPLIKKYWFYVIKKMIKNIFKF